MRRPFKGVAETLAIAKLLNNAALRGDENTAAIAQRLRVSERTVRRLISGVMTPRLELASRVRTSYRVPLELWTDDSTASETDESE